MCKKSDDNISLASEESIYRSSELPPVVWREREQGLHPAVASPSKCPDSPCAMAATPSGHRQGCVCLPCLCLQTLLTATSYCTVRTCISGLGVKYHTSKAQVLLLVMGCLCQCDVWPAELPQYRSQSRLCRMSELCLLVRLHLVLVMVSVSFVHTPFTCTQYRTPLDVRSVRM